MAEEESVRFHNESTWQEAARHAVKIAYGFHIKLRQFGATFWTTVILRWLPIWLRRNDIVVAAYESKLKRLQKGTDYS